MPFTVPDEAEASFPAQAGLFQSDIDILVASQSGAGVLSGCAVTAQGTPDMTLAVSAGAISIGGETVLVTAGNVTITTADATNPRFDLVVVSNLGVKSVVAGTPAAYTSNVSTPILPALPTNSVALAAVWVPANDTAIGSTQIVDKRVAAGVIVPEGAPSNPVVGEMWWDADGVADPLPGTVLARAANGDQQLAGVTAIDWGDTAGDQLAIDFTVLTRPVEVIAHLPATGHTLSGGSATVTITNAANTTHESGNALNLFTAKAANQFGDMQIKAWFAAGTGAVHAKVRLVGSSDSAFGNVAGNSQATIIAVVR